MGVSKVWGFLAGLAGGAGAVATLFTYQVGRRDLLRRVVPVMAGALTGVRLAAVATGGRADAAAEHSVHQRTPWTPRGMPPEVTPNEDFYQVSKNFFDPTVNVGAWRLEVKGLVNRPLRLSLDELKAVSTPTDWYQTLECIGNLVGGHLIGNAKWTCIPVKDVLARAGLQSGAATIIWRCADGYSESIPLAYAQQPESLLAYEMNDQPLPQGHGAPVRVLLPNRYGFKNPKWLTSIEVASLPYGGYWEQQRWSKEGIVKIMSAFVVRRARTGALELGGWAFAGNRGISKVEVSPDHGKMWLPATVKEPLNANCWQFWSAEWTPPGPGEYSLQVRAYDGPGMLQPAEPKPSLPDGAQGYHTVRVKV